VTDFEAVVRRHQDKVRNTCYRFVNDREDADDLAQEVFVQVYAALGRFREEAELSTWIYRIAVNKSLDFVRRARRKKRLARLRSLFGPSGEELGVAGSPGDEPLDRLEAEERRRALAGALDSLPSSQRTAVTLSRIEGFDHAEIGAVMGLSVAAVEALIHRAKKNLHKELSRRFGKVGERPHGSGKNGV